MVPPHVPQEAWQHALPLWIPWLQSGSLGGFKEYDALPPALTLVMADDKSPELCLHRETLSVSSSLLSPIVLKYNSSALVL
jgi:hypothetical protein